MPPRSLSSKEKKKKTMVMSKSRKEKLRREGRKRRLCGVWSRRNPRERLSSKELSLSPVSLLADFKRSCTLMKSKRNARQGKGTIVRLLVDVSHVQWLLPVNPLPRKRAYSESFPCKDKDMVVPVCTRRACTSCYACVWTSPCSSTEEASLLLHGNLRASSCVYVSLKSSYTLTLGEISRHASVYTFTVEAPVFGWLLHSYRSEG